MLPIDADSSYASGLLPTFVLVGIGFGLAYGPLNIAATAGVAGHEQGLASGLVTTSFQVGAALVLAVVAAVYDPAGTATAADFRVAIAAPLVATAPGVLAAVVRRPRRYARVTATPATECA